ncbi:hypothetical protein H6P81_009567 [Aristolochia fimbriata]|uniref:Uncharacterized protein n=1 Tax=Aristolochia fimbriata TaxID=158543 RepID=A0AAV7EL95_ARIFI|nr:hypothetical protein H6P81_009567 [Aristolochia fimbriata]
MTAQHKPPYLQRLRFAADPTNSDCGVCQPPAGRGFPVGWESCRLFTLKQPIQIPNRISWREFGSPNSKPMEFLTLSKFKLQLQALIGEIRDLREREGQARDDLQLSIQKQKQSDAVFGETLQTMREDLALCNESREKLEIEVKCLQQENTMLEMKQKELKEIINSLLQSRETFVQGYEDSTCELKCCIEKRDKRLILLSRELQAHLKLFDSIQIEAFSVKQIVEKVECLVNEKEQVGMFKATLFSFHCKGVIFLINKGENAIFKKSVAELKRKMDGISTLEKETKGMFKFFKGFDT